eukprot:scaffold74156_cov51-Phaeocystis_antarctica.AAC.2
MPIRACHFPASISSWLKSLSVGCGSAQAAQRPAKRHWTGAEISRARKQGGGLSVGVPSNTATAVSSQGCPRPVAHLWWGLSTWSGPGVCV